MSSILEALKKLETDAEAGSRRRPAIKGRKGFSAFAGPTQARPVFLAAAGIVLLVVFGMAVWHTAVIVTGSRESVVSGAASQAGDPQTKNSSDPGQEPSPGEGAVGSEPQIIPPSADLPERLDTKAQATSVQETPSENEAAGQEASGPEKASQPDAEVMRGDPLTLQAVSWSSSPQKRFAVINGRICREGDSIQDFIIRRINAEDVRLEGRGKTWRLIFNQR